MILRCAHPHCRTSLDEYPVTCPHGRAFCDNCTWEEACDECANTPPADLYVCPACEGQGCLTVVTEGEPSDEECWACHGSGERGAA